MSVVLLNCDQRMSMNGKKVLVVEDNQDIRDAIKMVIEFEGYDVLTASNGKEALDLLSALKTLPSLIFLDLMMPIMDGWSFAEKINQEKIFTQIPLVVISAFLNKETIPTNACDYLEKPMNFDKLLSTLKLHCG
jgi:CheY-like chemotaxis protein